jgi:hypothetical protein
MNPTAPSMTLVARSMRSGANSWPSATAMTQGAARTATTARSLRRGDTAIAPAAAPAMRNNASTPTTSRPFAQYCSVSMSGIEMKPGRTSMIA